MTASTVPMIVNAAAQLDIDVDTLDVDLTQHLIALGIHPNDMTSNQFIVADALKLPSTAGLLEQVIVNSPGADLLTLLDRVSVLLCAQNLPNISGRVLLQASPALAYDTAATVAHARAYATEFAAMGISKDRFCIKILCTAPGMLAAKMLEEEGIRTLGTGIFSVPQAIAAAQAGCLYISPYFNEILVHSTPPEKVPVYEDALQHPMAPRMAQMYEAYRKLSSKLTPPVIKAASFVATNEVMVMATLGSQQATILAPLLRQMCQLTVPPAAIPGAKLYRPAKDYSTELPAAALPLLSIDPLRADGVAEPAAFDVDYLANHAELLTRAIAADPEADRRLKDAVTVFQRAENEAKLSIEEAKKLV